MEKLPADIVLEIFYRLPPESVIRCTFVCKSWRNLIPRGHGNYFTNMHMRGHHQSNLDSTLNFIVLHEFRDQKEGNKVGEFHITEYDEEELNGKLKIINFPRICAGGWDSRTRLVGSCNGLLCLIRTYQSSFCKGRIEICNPLLHEYVPLPLSDLRYKYDSMSDMVIGFGYHPVTDEYKVIRVYYQHLGLNIGDVEVYTLGKRKKRLWRSKGTIECRLLGCSRSVLVNGSLHWLTAGTGKYRSQLIVSFDLENEEFFVIPLPRYSYMSNLKLEELGGCLCLIEEFGDGMGIWVLKDYMNKGSWVKEFEIEWVGKPWCYSPCAIKKKKDGNDDEILLWRSTKRLVHWKNGDGDEIPLWCNSKRLVSYDPKTRNFEEVFGRREVVVTESVHGCNPVLHISSLISLKFLGEDGKLYRESWRNKGCIRRAKKRNKVVEFPWTSRKYVR